MHAPRSMAACIWSTISTFSLLAAAPHRAGLLLSITEQTPSRSKQGEMYLDGFAKLKTAGRQALMPQAASLHIQVCLGQQLAGGLQLLAASHCAAHSVVALRLHQSMTICDLLPCPVQVTRQLLTTLHICLLHLSWRPNAFLCLLLQELQQLLAAFNTRNPLCLQHLLRNLPATLYQPEAYRPNRMTIQATVVSLQSFV